MQQLVQDVMVAPRPASAQHVGDLAWQRFQHVGREPYGGRSSGRRTAGVSRTAGSSKSGVLDFCVHPGRVRAARRGARLGRRERDATCSIGCTTQSQRSSVTASCAQPDDEPFFALPRPRPRRAASRRRSRGFALRTVGEADVECAGRGTPERVRAVARHRRELPQRHARLAVPRRPRLHRRRTRRASRGVLPRLARRARIASGELEPVGTHADFRRRGLAAAVCTFALRRLREEGAELAVVYARGDAAYPAPKLLYESLGFRAAGADDHLPPARVTAARTRRRRARRPRRSSASSRRRRGSRDARPRPFRSARLRRSPERGATTSSVRSSESNRKSTWLRTTSLRSSNPGSAASSLREASRVRAACARRSRRRRAARASAAPRRP